VKDNKYSAFNNHERIDAFVLCDRYNCIKDMGALQLSRLTGLKALFLQGNYNMAIWLRPLCGEGE